MFIFSCTGLGVNVLLLLTIGHEHPPGQDCGHDHGQAGCSHGHGHGDAHGHGHDHYDPVNQVLSEAKNLKGMQPLPVSSLHLPASTFQKCLW